MSQKIAKINLWNLHAGCYMRGLVFGGVITPTKGLHRRFNRINQK
ncbi:MAG: hypothetical protein Q8N22_00790 [bacterium]|nr:hypothetical protein [bacterium]